MSDAQYVVVGSRPWNRELFEDTFATGSRQWLFVGDRAALTKAWLDEVSPRYVFFMHWSWIVPSEILEAHECVCFHMTDVPYGRGGSPLQNLIVRGHASTVLTALRMTEEVDAGPVYMKRPLSLEGAAEEIYRCASQLSIEMMREIAAQCPEPTPQEGEPVLFTRRKPEESAVPADLPPEKLYDFIRMLDAEGYPHAFINVGGYRVELRHASLDGDRVSARVEITPAQENESL